MWTNAWRMRASKAKKYFLFYSVLEMYAKLTWTVQETWDHVGFEKLNAVPFIVNGYTLYNDELRITLE